MARGKKQRPPAIGMPTSVLVVPARDGRAQSVAGVGCGRPDPDVVDAEQAKDRAAGTVRRAAGLHGRTVRIDWRQRPDGSWAGHLGEGAAR
ncbi:hypothetical protein ACFWSF_10890 [Streptomyces sp. NPDC058611]|uniref:hypothetical protein n=1 Tax=unclassified Streptomyces TaxID=2593676 RepID=UPI0036634DE0